MSLSKLVKEIISNHWSFLAEAIFEPTAQGSSQTTYFVSTADNQFILKLYGATTEAVQIQYEHSLLTFLQSTNFPFAIPIPISTTDGETFVAVETDS